MSYWKSKVVPKLKKIFEKGGKKKGAAEACKQFESSKESIEKELGEKKEDLQPKVIGIYTSTTTIVSKKLLKEPNEPAVKQNPDAVQSLLQELAKAGFPGAQDLCDAGVKYGPNLLPGPIVYIFEKTSTFLVEEQLPEEPAQETRDIPVEEVLSKEASKEPEAAPEGKIISPVVEGGAGPSTSKEEDAAIPTTEGIKEEEPKPVMEAKKDEAIPAEEPPKPVVEATKDESVPIATTVEEKEKPSEIKP